MLKSELIATLQKYANECKVDFRFELPDGTAILDGIAAIVVTPEGIVLKNTRSRDDETVLWEQFSTRGASRAVRWGQSTEEK